MVVCQTIFCRLAILNFRLKKLSNGTRTSDNHSLSVSIKSNLQFLRKAFLLLMPIILCHVVDLVIVAIFNFQTTQVYFVQDWKIPVKFTFKVFSLFRKENMLNFVLKLPSTWVSGSYKRLTVRDYHSIMYSLPILRNLLWNFSLVQSSRIFDWHKKMYISRRSSNENSCQICF